MIRLSAYKLSNISSMKINQCSIVVCTFNRLSYLKKCLASLEKLDFPEYEIIIVDDGSQDGTKQFLENLKNEKIKVIHHKYNQGISSAKNSGIKIARYDIIAFTDDDCEVDKNWLNELFEGFKNENDGFSIGKTVYIRENYQGYFPERLVTNGNAQWPGGGNIAYRKKVFDVCGNFDDLFFKYNNEDSEMAIRAVSYGFFFRRTPKAIVRHQAMIWNTKSLLKSARNASVWPILKKRYKKHYLCFSPPIKMGIFIQPQDYLYLLTAPIFIPALLARYILHGKKDWKIFFVKWPVYFILKRFYIYREVLRNKVLMF